MHKSPFVAVNAGVSLVTQILMPVENMVIGAPAATAPADAGTAVPLLVTTPLVVESVDTPEIEPPVLL